MIKIFICHQASCHSGMYGFHNSGKLSFYNSQHIFLVSYAIRAKKFTLTASKLVPWAEHQEVYEVYCVKYIVWSTLSEVWSNIWCFSALLVITSHHVVMTVPPDSGVPTTSNLYGYSPATWPTSMYVQFISQSYWLLKKEEWEAVFI